MTLGLFVYCILRYRRVATVLPHGCKWHAVSVCLASEELLQVTQIRSRTLLREDALSERFLQCGAFKHDMNQI